MTVTNLLKFTVFFSHVKRFSRLLALWPLSYLDESDQRKRYLYWFKRWFVMVNYVLIIIPLTMAVYKRRNDTLQFAISSMETLGAIEALLGYVSFGLQFSRFRVLLQLLENSRFVLVKNLRFIYLSYFEVIVYLTVAQIYLVRGLVNICGTLPASAWYPFDTTTSAALNHVLRLHQLFVIYNTFVTCLADATCWLILQFTVYKLRLLVQDFKAIQNYDQLSSCVIRHQRLLCFIEEMQVAMSGMIVKTVFVYFGFMITSGLVLIRTEYTSFLFCIFSAIAMAHLIRMYIITENDYEISKNHDKIKSVMFDLICCEKPVEVTKFLIIIMQKCQKPIEISYFKMMPILNMRFLTKYVYVNSYYFLILRLIYGRSWKY